MITAFDIGGSAIKSAIVRGPEDIVALKRKPTPARDFAALTAEMRQMIADNPNPSRGIAISVAGVVDPATGLANCANIPCFTGRRIAADLQHTLELPVWLANDADCFALAEAQLGAGRGHANVFGIILGTGVGGGLVLNGELVPSAGGFSGEWGHGCPCPSTSAHWPEPIPAFACGCGLVGCVDTIGSARGMERLHAHLHHVDLPSTQITENWLAGNTDATTTIAVMTDLVASPLTMVLNVTGSTIAPVGGGLSSVTPLLELLDTKVRARMLHQSKAPVIVPGECATRYKGLESGLIGAALLGLQKLAD